MYSDAYRQIVNLLNITSVDAQNQQQVKDAMVNYVMAQLGVIRPWQLHTSKPMPYLRAAGIEKGSCHLFHHAMATQMLENGADLRWIQLMLGHQSVESTQIYAQVSIRALQAVHASTHPAEWREEEKPDRPENNGHNDTTIDTTTDTTTDTTKGAWDEHNPLQNR